MVQLRNILRVEADELAALSVYVVFKWSSAQPLNLRVAFEHLSINNSGDAHLSDR